MIIDRMVPIVPEKAEDVEVEVMNSQEDSLEEADASNFMLSCMETSQIHRGPLVLVNNDFPITDIDTGIVSVYDQKTKLLYVRDLSIKLMDEAMLALNQMAEDFHTATGHADIIVKNGYITSDEQKVTYEAALQKNGGSTQIAIPGGNELESGYSFELSLLVNGAYLDFTDKGDYEWIMQHCAEYGFVQRFPTDKAEYTHVENKPWIFRYVGTPHAWNMYKNNLCLEEYLTMLEQYTADGEHYIIYDQIGRQYEVYYVSIDPNDPATEVYIPTPLEGTFTVSGNNKHGFIVTTEIE